MNSIFAYTSYRKYLLDYYRNKKETTSGFSFRVFARKAKLPSAMHFSLVAEAKRNLTHKTIPAFLQGLGLKGREAEYFENLVYYEQAKNLDQKELYLQRLLKIKVKNVKAGTTSLSEQLNKSLYAHWYYPLVYELVLLKDFEESGDWIARRLCLSISPAQARSAITRLLSSGLLSRKNGRLVQSEKSVRSKDEIENLLIRLFQKKMIQESLAKQDLPLSQREFRGLTIALNTEQLPYLKSEIKKVVKRLNQELTQDPGPKNAVYQLNIQLVPVTTAEQ